MSEPVHISTVMREIMEKFKPNRKFKKEYDRLFKKDPIAANTFLLLAELADEKGQVKIAGTTEEEIAKEIQSLLMARFNDPEEYALGGTENE